MIEGGGRNVCVDACGPRKKRHEGFFLNIRIQCSYCCIVSYTCGICAVRPVCMYLNSGNGGSQ